MSTADLLVIANTLVDLAALGIGGALVYTRRIVFAATPKAPVQQQGTADGQPAAIPGGTP